MFIIYLPRAKEEADLDAEQEPPSSLLTQALRWLDAFDKAMNSEPGDLLERRVATLERRLARGAEVASNGRPFPAPRSTHAGEV